VILRSPTVTAFALPSVRTSPLKGGLPRASARRAAWRAPVLLDARQDRRALGREKSPSEAALQRRAAPATWRVVVVQDVVERVVPEAAIFQGKGLTALAPVVSASARLEEPGHVVVVDVAHHHQVDVERVATPSPRSSRAPPASAAARRRRHPPGRRRSRELRLRLGAGVETSASPNRARAPRATSIDASSRVGRSDGLERPQHVEHDRALEVALAAEVRRRRRDRICLKRAGRPTSSLCRAIRSAAAPLTCGAAMLVPSLTPKGAFRHGAG
jgi:hypothetical protein